jgi:hypothetical protein
VRRRDDLFWPCWVVTNLGRQFRLPFVQTTRQPTHSSFRKRVFSLGIDVRDDPTLTTEIAYSSASLQAKST